MIKKIRGKFWKNALICAMVISLIGSGSFAASVPADVAGSAQEEAVVVLVEAGVITGSTDGLFYPLNNLTRAEACTIIVRAINPPDADLVGTPIQRVPSSGFTDMFNHWAESYVSYAVRHNIVNGYPDGTFKPNNNVTCNEMLAMVLRAVGFTNEEIGTDWPGDFIAKADQEGITAGLPEELPELATKEIAARMAYNKLDELRAVGAAQYEDGGDESSENTSGDEPLTWDTEDLFFATGSFNNNMTAYAGMPISANVEVYTYGVRSNYKRDMELPEKQSEYRRDTIHKYKATETPGFYIRTGNEITLLILPMDVGFTGRIYGVINDSGRTTNGRGEVVNNIHTLAAGRQVSWLTRDSVIDAPAESERMSGQIYELTSVNGMINNISTVGHKDFVELTTKNEWMEVKEFIGRVIELEDNGKMIAVEDNAVVYILNQDGKSYRVGRLGDIVEGSEIRAFSISEDDEIASHITVNRK